MIVDTVLVELKELREESVLAILAALQAYEKNAFEKHAAFYRTRLGEGNLQLNMLLVRSPEDDKFDFIFQKCMNHLQGIFSTVGVAMEFVFDKKLDLTSFVVLREDVARDLAKRSDKHLSQTFGIMLGAEAGSLPNVDALAPSEYEVKQNWIKVKNPVCSIHFPKDAPSKFLIDDEGDGIDRNTLQDKINLSFTCAAYVGGLSFESYFMSALKKPVFEVSTDKHLYKWSNPNYFHSSMTNHNDSILEKGVALCLNRLAQEK